MHTENGICPTRSALVLFGTETGNAQDIAYELGQSLQRHHFHITTRELDLIKLQDLTRHDIVVFALSTTGQGDFPSNSRKFWLSLLKKKLTATSLHDVNYALVGLCDSSYPKFNLAGRKLHKRLTQLGASSILQPCEADEQGEDGTEGAFLAWLALFERQILSDYPVSDNQTPIPAGERLPNEWTLEFSGLIKSSTNGHVVPAAISKASPEPSFEVTLEVNDRVTPTSHWQDVRLLRLRSEQSINYMPGDALAIRPQNSTEDVDDLITLQNWQDIADTQVRLKSSRHSEDFDTVLTAHQSYTLRELLTKYLDINSIPRRSFFAKIAHFTNDEMQKERALEFTNPEYLDEYFDYATRPRRSILEVLQEFHTVMIPWQEMINVFPLLRPRQFSIASGGRFKDGGHSFDLLVAIVKYRTVIKRIRQGVCTQYLAKLTPGAILDVVLHTEGRFHNSTIMLNRQYLLVGGGTGIAPLRALIQEKEMSWPRSKSTLIFGCRNRKADYFFGEEWQASHGNLQVITAFSRDQDAKVYVQDRIREQAAHIREVLKDENSTIIVCGSSGAMPKAVRQALKDVLVIDEIDDTAAESVLLHLEKTARYKQETW